MFNVIYAHCITINKLNIKSKWLNDLFLLVCCVYIKSYPRLLGDKLKMAKLSILDEETCASNCL